LHVTAAPADTTDMHCWAEAPVIPAQHVSRPAQPLLVLLPCVTVTHTPDVWSEASSALQLVATFEVTTSTHVCCWAPETDPQQVARL
jgi:hypothetical protein